MTDHFLDLENGESAQIRAPGICIVMTTFLRTELALRTIQGVVDNLDYPKELRTWYIADDGSPVEHVDTLRKKLDENQETLCGYHNENYSQRPSCGIGWNKALEFGHQTADIILWLEDDWVLETPLDIRPYIRLLLERDDVGMVTMRGLSTGLRAEVVGHNGIHYWKVLRQVADSTMAYSGNPLLRHTRYLNFYGHFAIHCAPGDIEILYNRKYIAAQRGPEIWRPASIGAWGCWGHIGSIRTW